MTDLRTPPTDWTVDEGDAWTVTVTLTDKATGAPVVITGATLVGKIRFIDDGTVGTLTTTLVSGPLGKFSYGQADAQRSGAFRVRVNGVTRAKGDLIVAPDRTEVPMD